MNNNSIKNGVRFIAMWAWPVLGFYRGLNSYNYNYVKNKLYRHSNPFYIDKIVWGAVGTLIYLNPINYIYKIYSLLFFKFNFFLFFLIRETHYFKWANPGTGRPN